jgi:hypothetical protein
VILRLLAAGVAHQYFFVLGVLRIIERPTFPLAYRWNCQNAEGFKLSDIADANPAVCLAPYSGTESQYPIYQL